jgi:hypothetical protein
MKRFASTAFLSLGLALFALAAAPACSSGSTSSAPIVGVDDVLKACQIRATWTNTSSTPCNNCFGLATTPRCACSDQEYAGKCNDQTAAKNKEPTCDGTDACVSKCAKGDCACADACYAGKATCRTLASAADGCVAEVCDSYCK